MRDPISRKEARELGLLRYYTGRPCKRGHFAERWISTAMCVECLNQHNSRWKKEHLAQCTAAKREWRSRNFERVRDYKREYYARSESERQNQAARARRWMEANPEKSAANSNAYRRRNLAAAAARQQRRRAKLLKCMPSWANLDAIQKFYDLAKELTDQTGIPHEVDHIIPLQGELVTGLHIETNLQVLPAKVNRSKGARFSGIS